MRSFRRGTLAGISAVFVAVSAVQAGFTPSFTGTSTSLGLNTSYNYEFLFGVNVPPAERLDPGDFLTIYDILGFVSATPPANFTTSVQNVGIDGFGTLPGDDPSLPNVTFTYTGPSVSVDTVFTGASIVSSLSFVGTDYFTSETTNNTQTPVNGTAIGHIGFVPVPAPIPEPASAMFLSAASVLLLSRRRT